MGVRCTPSAKDCWVPPCLQCVESEGNRGLFRELLACTEKYHALKNLLAIGRYEVPAAEGFSQAEALKRGGRKNHRQSRDTKPNYFRYNDLEACTAVMPYATRESGCPAGTATVLK